MPCSLTGFECESGATYAYTRQRGKVGSRNTDPWQLARNCKYRHGRRKLSRLMNSGTERGIGMIPSSVAQVHIQNICGGRRVQIVPLLEVVPAVHRPPDLGIHGQCRLVERSPGHGCCRPPTRRSEDSHPTSPYAVPSSSSPPRSFLPIASPDFITFLRPEPRAKLRPCRLQTVVWTRTSRIMKMSSLLPAVTKRCSQNPGFPTSGL